MGERGTIKPEVPAYEAFFTEAFGQIMAALGQQGLAPTGAPASHYLCYTPDEVELEAVMPVAGEVQVQAPLTSATRPAGPAIGILHQGPYEGLQATYDKLNAYLQAHKLGDVRQVPLAIEVYLTDPGAEPDASKWETEVYYMLPQ